jgi:hypothetical protein
MTILRLLIVAAALALLSAGCGGGGGAPVTPNNPNDNDQDPGGDPPVPIIPGQAQGDFTLPGGRLFGDLRGVAASQNYVYVCDTTTIYAFNKFGGYLRELNLSDATPAPTIIHGVATFPPRPALPEFDGLYDDYIYTNLPVVVHSPVADYGYITILGATLDFLTDIPDGSHPDAAKFIALPHGFQIDPPGLNPPPPGPPCCLNVFDIKVDRFGSILVTMDLSMDCQTLTYPSTLQVLSVFENFNIVTTGEFQDPNDPDNPLNGQGIVGWHPALGQAVGFLATIATDMYYPRIRPELTYNLYTGDTNLQRDYIGIAQISLDLNAVVPTYSMTAPANNAFGYDEVIGESFGNGPGSFSLDPPFNPAGGLEDPDIVAGGPYYMSVDKGTDNLLVCDPGNRRIQVFDPVTHEFLRQYGDGLRGNAGNHFIAPSHAETDLEGNIYVTDVNQLRILRASPADRSYGNVGGTVTDFQNGNRIQGATITLGNELGALATGQTNINGQYIVNSLLTGTYYLTATKFNYQGDNASVQIFPDETSVVNFRLIPNQPATLGGYTGVVIDSATNLPIDGATVTVVTTSLTAQTDATGAFEIGNITPGTYQVTYGAPGYATLTRQVEILAGQIRNDQLIQLVPTI